MAKAKQVVKVKRLQKAMETWLRKISKYVSGNGKFTKLYRKYLIRIWLYRKGFIFKGISKYTQRNKKGDLVPVEIKKKSNNENKTIAAEEMETLTHRILSRRVFFHRNMLFGSVEQKYIAALEVWHF